MNTREARRRRYRFSSSGKGLLSEDAAKQQASKFVRDSEKLQRLHDANSAATKLIRAQRAGETAVAEALEAHGVASPEYASATRKANKAIEDSRPKVAALHIATSMNAGRATIGLGALSRATGRCERALQVDIAALRDRGYLAAQVAAYNPAVGRRERCNQYTFKDSRTAQPCGLKAHFETQYSYGDPENCKKGHRIRVIQDSQRRKVLAVESASEEGGGRKAYTRAQRSDYHPNPTANVANSHGSRPCSRTIWSSL